jgi:hypothetical protein
VHNAQLYNQYSSSFSSSSSSMGVTVHDEPWTLFTSALLWSRSCEPRLRFLMSILFKSSSTESSHLIAGPPTRIVLSGSCRVNFLQGLCSCILTTCLSHLNRPTLITFTISGSLYKVPNYTLIFIRHFP